MQSSIFYLIYVGSFLDVEFGGEFDLSKNAECPVRIQRINDHSLLEKLKSMKTCKVLLISF